MLKIVLFFALWNIGGFAGRVRGSDLINSHFVSRFGVWGIPTGLSLLVATYDPIYALVGVILAGLGASPGYWGDFNLVPAANRTWSNALKLATMGCVRYAPLCAASFIWWDGFRILPAVLAGISFYPAYLAGVWASAHFEPKLKLGGKYLLKDPSEWGEWFFWGTIFVAINMGLFL